MQLVTKLLIPGAFSIQIAYAFPISINGTFCIPVQSSIEIPSELATLWTTYPQEGLNRQGNSIYRTEDYSLENPLFEDIRQRVQQLEFQNTKTD
ncbi:hypothetical protein CLIM01_11585 [Colletotrichum limetticola]|uniref:Uncharacterized protein n=1 Tax=Colletotrichum limetticola TaxID=1209924 RepID=A0ABQ9PKT6_9PEZI|nr:hypothetical protein CLIM01_11585 [Colletotrichum limetticola]